MKLQHRRLLRRSILVVLVLVLGDGCYQSGIAGPPFRPKPEGGKSMSQVRVRVIGPDGKLSNPRDVPMLVLSNAEWHKRLTPEQFRITRGKDTEPAFCGGLLHNTEAGMYVCVCCNLPLFESGANSSRAPVGPVFSGLPQRRTSARRLIVATEWSAQRSFVSVAGHIWVTCSTTDHLPPAAAIA